MQSEDVCKSECMQRQLLSNNCSKFLTLKKMEYRIQLCNLLYCWKQYQENILDEIRLLSSLDVVRQEKSTRKR